MSWLVGSTNLFYTSDLHAKKLHEGSQSLIIRYVRPSAEGVPGTSQQGVMEEEDEVDCSDLFNEWQWFSQ